jgi:Flp pilus assembly pilin Flp
MMQLKKYIRNYLRRFSRAEDGNASIEFVMMVPIALAIAISGFETGIFSYRQVMLERNLDIVVREIRIGKLNLDHSSSAGDMQRAIKERICHHSVTIPNCMSAIRLDMRVQDLRSWITLPDGGTCVDRSLSTQPLPTIQNGGNNQLVILRACTLYKPLLPNAAPGKSLAENSEGEYALFATSSFVMEPYK